MHQVHWEIAGWNGGSYICPELKWGFFRSRSKRSNAIFTTQARKLSFLRFVVVKNVVFTLGKRVKFASSRVKWNFQLYFIGAQITNALNIRSCSKRNKISPKTFFYTIKQVYTKGVHYEWFFFTVMKKIATTHKTK